MEELTRRKMGKKVALETIVQIMAIILFPSHSPSWRGGGCLPWNFRWVKTLQDLDVCSLTLEMLRRPANNGATLGNQSLESAPTGGCQGMPSLCHPGHPSPPAPCSGPRAWSNPSWGRRTVLNTNGIWGFEMTLNGNCVFIKANWILSFLFFF